MLSPVPKESIYLEITLIEFAHQREDSQSGILCSANVQVQGALGRVTVDSGAILVPVWWSD